MCVIFDLKIDQNMFGGGAPPPSGNGVRNLNRPLRNFALAIGIVDVSGLANGNQYLFVQLDTDIAINQPFYATMQH